MDKLIHFFEHIHSWQRAAALVGGILFFWALEAIIPLFHNRYQKVRHAGLNLLFTFTTVIINLLFASLTVAGSIYTNRYHTGLLNLVSLPLWLYILLGLMILDLISSWLIHWMEHQVKWMWKFHIIHHSDTWVDTTTANRHHPGESIFRAVFTFLAVIVTGAPLWLLYFYQFLSVLFSQFNHANISLPGWLDNILSWLIVSPDMHKVHHHYVQPYTDSNYGNIFSIWDRLFGTFVRVKDIRSIRYGIDTYMKEEENNDAAKLMKIPFEPYRPPAGAKFSTRDQ
ncbi:MAG TPA: sterol desaturase family protein [Puia sp.]|nr:sterol desaturase family protein [Puia sp.]